MHTIHKTSGNFVDQLELVNENGESVVIEINLIITPALIQEYRKLQIRLMDLQKAHDRNPEESGVVERIGETIIALLALVFGESNTRQVMDFYAGDYVTLLTDITPYIRDVIVPKLQTIAKARKAQFKRRFR